MGCLLTYSNNAGWIQRCTIPRQEEIVNRLVRYLQEVLPPELRLQNDAHHAAFCVLLLAPSASHVAGAACFPLRYSPHANDWAARKLSVACDHPHHRNGQTRSGKCALAIGEVDTQIVVREVHIDVGKRRGIVGTASAHPAPATQLSIGKDRLDGRISHEYYKRGTVDTQPAELSKKGCP
jgi:hypothetical protein